MGWQWVYLFDGGPDEAVKAANEALHMWRVGAPDLSALDWKGWGDLTVEAYEAVAAKR